MEDHSNFCPKCGSIQTRSRTSDNFDIKYQIFCVDCLLTADWCDSIEQAIHSWNHLELK